MCLCGLWTQLLKSRHSRGTAPPTNGIEVESKHAGSITSSPQRTYVSEANVDLEISHKSRLIQPESRPQDSQGLKLKRPRTWLPVTAPEAPEGAERGFNHLMPQRPLCLQMHRVVMQLLHNPRNSARLSTKGPVVNKLTLKEELYARLGLCNCGT